MKCRGQGGLIKKKNKCKHWEAGVIRHMRETVKGQVLQCLKKYRKSLGFYSRCHGRPPKSISKGSLRHSLIYVLIRSHKCRGERQN